MPARRRVSASLMPSPVMATTSLCSPCSCPSCRDRSHCLLRRDPVLEQRPEETTPPRQAAVAQRLRPVRAPPPVAVAASCLLSVVVVVIVMGVARRANALGRGNASLREACHQRRSPTSPVLAGLLVGMAWAFIVTAARFRMSRGRDS